MSSCNSTADLYLRPLPFLDAKWLRADLISSLRNVEDAAVLWNNLIQDCELVSSPAAPVLNAAGHLSYLGDDGKHYCGVQKLQCSCCPLDYCGPLSACNCSACRTLDSDSAIKKMTTAVQNAAANRISSEVIFESWLWGQSPNTTVKLNCQNTLLVELHDISLQAAGNCLSAIHLRQQLFIYERYFVALSRWKQQQELQCHINIGMSSNIISSTADKCKFNEDQRSAVNSGISPMRIREMNYHATTKLRHFSTVDVPSPIKENERATLGLARVGTRAALNFSFAFLRRAWRSGEDTEMCSELLSEALESLQDLPEASLFDATQVSPLWIEVLERSIKFLRQVALGDPLGGRCTAPREDRHTALCLLLELGAQKGTLAATLEAIVLLLMLWEKEKETDDNRDVPQNTGAPLVPILRRYESIGNYGINNIAESAPASATESFLRFLTLPEQETTNVDLKQAAVVIVSHLDRLAKPHLPTSTASAPLPARTQPLSAKPILHAQASQESASAASTPQLHEQRIYALGWQTLCHDQYGFTAEPAVGLTAATNTIAGAHYPAPVLNFYFQVKQVAFSEEYVLFLTHEGKMYTWRITKPETEPMLIEEMNDVQVTAVTAHCEGRHFMVVDNMENAYSWGCGEGGRLGHGDSLLRDHPTKIQSLEHSVKAVYCGCTYSAAITMNGNLYTWGRGTYGRLGHGNSDDKLLPTHVYALREHSIIDVALGSGDSHTLCLTAEGLVFAWGDGDYGKLGNGSCNGSQLPLLVETLPLIKRVFAGSQFSMALSCDGKLYSWGKAYDGRLGHGLLDKNVQCLNTPKQISALQSKVIVHVSVGVWHCLAMSNKGEVFGWGRNDFQQVCPAAVSKEPILRDPILATHPSVQAYGIACGAAQSIIWSQTSVQGVPVKIAFVIDLSEHTFRLLDQLLGIVCGQDSNNRQTPNQESECIAVACLNLLRLQLHALIVNSVTSKSVGLSEGSRLLVSLKTRILSLAGGSNVLKTMQEAAQWTLQVGWSVLLPTASERAQTLTSLLPSDSGISSSGHRFMTDLLVGSLMAEGGLETALKQAIRREANDCTDNGHNLPLLHLIKQLLRNNSALTQARLTQLLINAGITKPEDDSFTTLSVVQSTTIADHTSPSLDLLHRFQRLLFAYIHQSKQEEISGAEALLSKYVQSAVSLCILSLQKAHEIALQGKESVADIIKTDISDTLLYELLIGLIILKRDRPTILPAFEWSKIFLPLLHALDNLNRVICDSEIQDSDDMGWPGIICRGNQKGANVQTQDDVNLIRKNDFENQILDGGKWIILNGYVCDVSDYQSDNSAINELLATSIGKDLTVELNTSVYRNCLEHILTNYKVGRYAAHVTEEKPYVQQSKVLTHFNSERALAYLLGLVVNLLQTGPAQQPAELQCKTIVRSSILRGGLQLLQPSNPFDEEKGEARSSASTAGSTPTEPPPHSLTVCGGIGTAGGGLGGVTVVAQPHINSVQQRIESFVSGLSEARLTDPLVVTWMTLSERYCKDNNLIWHQEFPHEHPVQELERLLTAVLIRHQSLGGLVLNVLERELGGVAVAKTPRQIADMIRLIYQTKWSVVRIRQQLNRSYKEVCAPMLERLRFLLYEVRPAVSLEQEALRKLPILHRLTRFKHVVRRIIVEMRLAKKQLACAKPEDILNVTIQSQNVAQKLNQSHESLLQSDGAASDSAEKDSGVCTTDSSSLASATVLMPPLRGNLSNENLLDGGDNNIILSERKTSNEEIKLQANELDFDEDKKPADDEPRLNNDLLRKLREKWYFSGELNVPIMHEIVEFVMQEVCDVETVRRAMYCQVQRYQIRRQGLEMLHAMLQVHGLLDAVQYNMLNGYLGLHLKSSFSKQATLNVLYDLNMITAFQKADLLLAQSRVLEWAVRELQRLVNQELIQLKGKYNAGNGKDTSNLGTYVFLKKLPRARFLLSVFGILAKDMSANELSLIVNSGTLGTVLGLLSQTGGEIPTVKNTYDLSVVYEDTILKQKSNKANLTGPELAKLMKIGMRIVRGADWKWGDQDGNPPGEGRIISEVGEDGWVRVEWYTGATNSYRMGKEGQYDLRLADNALNIISPDTETEKDELCCDAQLNGESHPTKLLRYACTKMLQIISVGIGLHSAQMDKSAVRCISCMFRSVLDPKSTLGNIYGLDNWTTLGFLKAIAGESKSLAKYLSSTTWIDFYISLLEQPVTREQDLFRNIHCLRLLQSILIHWTDDAHTQRIAFLVRQLFSTLGKITLYCPQDISLAQNVGDCKTRVLLTASHSGTIAEEIITLLRRLHTLPYWNAAINSFLAQKLCVAAELFGEDGLDLQHLENEYIYVMGVLCTIGGCDIRPRVGLQVCYEGNTVTICGFTNKGKCLLSTDGQTLNGEFRKISLNVAFECADYSVFSLSRMPLNEMLLNSWAVLLFGPGERKECVPNMVDISLLRAQQIQLSVLNANCVLYRHQAALRKILKQRSPGLCAYSSEESLSEEAIGAVNVSGEGKSNNEGACGGAETTNCDELNVQPTISDTELLIQSILIRATQPSPIKAIYTYSDLSTAALNCAQVLAAKVHNELNEGASTSAGRGGAFATPTPPMQPTMIHGVPVYNVGMLDEATGGSQPQAPKNDAEATSLIAQIMEMGFSKKSVELAVKQLTIHPEVIPTPEQIVQWILEHPDVCANTIDATDYLEPPLVGGNVPAAGSSSETSLQAKLQTLHDPEADSDNESLDSSSDTVEGSSIHEQLVKFETRKDFPSADQYALYVRGLVCPGMLVRCCRDFEEIKKGDIGTVLKVDTEGLHDLNVQVDWQLHGNTYWVCFVHIELLEMPREKTACERSAQVSVGTQVRLRAVSRYKWGYVLRGSVGTVTAVRGKDVTVDFPQHAGWKGTMNDIEVVGGGSNQVSGTIGGLHGLNSGAVPAPSDLIEDWSRCIRSLTVSSNEATAKHLLDRSPYCWQSSSSSQTKHWIRLEIHDHILVHSLSIVVSPGDHSHQPSLVVVRVGDSIGNLKDYSWISIKNTDTAVTLMSDVRQYYPWIEIVIKQCRNNGIQCKVHGLNIIGRRKQTDLDLLLMNASFLACEYEQMSDSNSCLNSAYGNADPKSSTLCDPPCTVMVWGLNDKEQLGGLKGSKVKVPTFSQTISRLRPIHIAGGSKSLFIVSQDGKVYACGEGTNGRLGLGISVNVSVPRQIPVLHQYVVKKVAVHSGGKHAMALTLDGKVFSWGEGEDGKLGHGNRLTMDKPKLIEALRAKKIRDIACGSSHSAAITSAGELYTWGLGEYGRLGHGDNVTQLKPKLVTALSGKRVIQVACGSRDAQTLALTEDGVVYSWGDGDFGKLGRGGSEGSSIPHEIERLTGIGVIQIECGAQFSLALTRTGEVWTWGKGDYYRLGHGSDQHVRKPQPIQALRGRKVIHLAVGALHCLAVTDTGQVYAWGDNDHGQQGSGNTVVNKKPALVIGLDSVFVNRVACGSSHAVAWGLPQSPSEDEKKGPVPFGTSKDPLGGSSLGIYDTDTHLNTPTTNMCKSSSSKVSLSETLLSLETDGARQTALNYVLNSMSILQARQLIVAALTSHSKVNLHEKSSNEFDVHEGSSATLGKGATIGAPSSTPHGTLGGHNGHHGNNNCNNNEVIEQGGGEAPADATDPAVHEPSPEAEIVPAPAGPLSAFQSLTGSLSLSASISSNAPHKHSKMSVSAMSALAATMTNQEEIIEEISLTGLDDFTSLLGEAEAKSLVELLKLSVAGRTGPLSTAQTISDTLTALGSNSPTIGAMLLETCITELEDLCTSRYSLGKVPKPVMRESSHPYVDNMTIVGQVKIPGAESLRIEFDSQCSTEKRNDPLVIMDASGRVVAVRSGREYAQWAPEVRILGDEMRWKFTSDSSVNGWGWRFWVHALMPATALHERGSDRAVLSQPSMPLVMALLNERLGPHNTSVLLRLAAALAACAQLNSLTTTQRIWSLKQLHSVLLSKHAPKPLDPSLNIILLPLIPELLRQYEYEEPQVRGGIHLMHSDYFKTLAALACDMQLDAALPPADVHKWAWFKRYCIAVRVAQSLIKRIELPRTFCMEVRKKFAEMMPPPQPSHSPGGGSVGSMMNSTTSLSSAGSTNSNPTPPPPPSSATMVNTLTPSTSNLIQYIDSMMSLSLHEPTSGSVITGVCSNLPPLAPSTGNDMLQFLHEDHTIFKSAHDSQLLQWLNRRPDDWALSWGGASTIYGWGHNHRGQLGGLEGSRIKTPTPCEALSLLRPVQLAGGEQTLFAVTPDGKCFATGYGSGGRLGVGGTDSWAIPTLIGSLQHVFVKKVAVNSGGKHCLALTTEGEVYSWGEGEDGKLGHGNRMSYDRPKLIEDLTGIGIVDIACGSAHSAAITSSGHVLTWGKGRYGRLGHGDSEDQLRPKLVEALLGYRAIDVACGSGDAQTLCITDDDNVWSWGDGDYGKLGRGGSDGCKLPYKIESLAGLGVVKVECGSQFSVALTKSGAVYTWGKGDFHRLGHGTVDHVRRPKKVAALQGKKIVSIATGSLHCVACTDAGEVFTWGDNDEGQLGDGTVSAIQRPRLVAALQNKHIVKVTCGSAHTIAMSTSQLTDRMRPPPNPPLEYDLVREMPPEALHARLVLLHHFSELLCPCLAMLPITGELSLGALKDVLVYTIKEAAFRKVIQTTMVRDKQHGPVIELNRIQVKRSRNKSGNGLAGIDGMKSVFGQMVQKLPLLTQEALSLPHRVWKVKFVGESVDDCGGGYSESIAEMCDELQNGSVPLLITTPNGRGEAGANRDCFLLDPTLSSVLQMNMFRFLGVLMGIAVRTGSPLSLNLAEAVWRQLAGELLRPSDLTEVDRDYVAGLLCIRNMDDDPKVFSTLELPFSTSSAKGHEVPLSTRYTRISPQNRYEYVRLALNFRLHEFDEQVKAVRDGMSKVIPVPLLSLFSASELQAMVCGSPDIPLGLLKSVATYKGFDPNSSLVTWFWEVMEEFSNQERSLFLRFVWGRTRLPRTIADFRGRDFVLQVLEKSPPDNFLPESYTCFFLLKMPRYSCKAVLLEKLKYAIHFCKSIDTDEYARVAMGDPTEATGSEDDSDLESAASNEA